ncbi:MAG: sigma-70 family RNA polymerase sigma factor [Gemmataceae bacterium]|nr:sigma-70 family RNA polymerase sigma factor [Gemmataceae bacterium]MDW8265884.1 sigma-70 family RNA polymerase sigma factor [Gemmataceae bacterium]
MTAESDRLLISQIRRGDANAWTTLIARYEGRLLAFVDRRLGDRAASEDVVQETFIGFLNSLPNYDDRRDLQTYLFTIASHKVTDYLRRVGRHPLQIGSDSVNELLDNQLDPKPAASSLARSRERLELEVEAVRRSLGPLIRTWQERGEFLRVKVLELLLVRGWSNREVADFLGIKDQQVANIRFAALKKLADTIREVGLPPDVFPELHAEDGPNPVDDT